MQNVDVIMLDWCAHNITYANDSQASLTHCASVMSGCLTGWLKNMFVSILILQKKRIHSGINILIDFHKPF